MTAAHIEVVREALEEHHAYHAPPKQFPEKMTHDDEACEVDEALTALDSLEAELAALREGDLGEARDYGDRWRTKANELVAELAQAREERDQLLLASGQLNLWVRRYRGALEQGEAEDRQRASEDRDELCSRCWTAPPAHAPRCIYAALTGETEPRVAGQFTMGRRWGTENRWHSPTGETP